MIGQPEGRDRGRDGSPSPIPVSSWHPAEELADGSGVGTRSRSAMMPDGRRTRCAGSYWGNPTTPREVEKRKIDVQSAENGKDQE